MIMESITSTTTLAFGMPGTTEWVIILVLGLLIFGRRLPEVGRSLGKTIRDLRGGLDSFRRELNSDQGFRDAQSAIRDIKKAVQVPRNLANPRRILTEMVADEDKDPKPEKGKTSKDQAADDPS